MAIIMIKQKHESFNFTKFSYLADLSVEGNYIYENDSEALY